MKLKLCVANLLLLAFLWSTAFAEDPKLSSSKKIQFNRDIRPILSDRCFLCHGPDRTSEQAEKSDLRLDQRDLAVDHGVFDFENVDESEILSRISSTDPNSQMPPPDSQKASLSESETELIRKWIAQEAPYEQHWAYLPPSRPAVPSVTHSKLVRNPIDAFVFSKLEQNGIEPAVLADRETLIRRVSLDLTGLPPSVNDINAFLADTDSMDVAFGKLVDRLLASPAYGEHQTRYWLDAARYADTSGYQYDFDREQWVWRDWVIAAFNENKPFDQFTIEQIAGDLLPDATDLTHLATAFNRNHPITIEGGVVDEEYRTEYVIDRVVTTGAVWLGQTFTCSRCHDHKYDPITQKDFYSFFAFFNNVPERGLNGFDPKRTIVSPLAEKRIQQCEQERESAQARLNELNIPFASWEKDLDIGQQSWEVSKPLSILSSGGATSTVLADGSVLMSGKNPSKDDYEIMLPITKNEVRTFRLEAILDPSLTNGSTSRGSNGNFVLTEFIVETASQADPTKFVAVKIAKAHADYEQNGFGIGLAIDGQSETQAGWAVDGNSKVENRTAFFELENQIPAGAEIRIRMLHHYGLSHQIGKFRLSTSKDVSPLNSPANSIASVLSIKPSERNAKQKSELHKFLLETYGNVEQKRAFLELSEAEERLTEAKKFPATMVMAEMPKPRDAFVLDRGEYDKPRKDEPVIPAVPASIGTLGSELPANRLGLAQWLVSDEQPLTARVTVNRFWQQIFGVGLVKTSEDFGSQGEYPSHPELLDWLAVEFKDSGWDVKQLFKTIVMSHTYQQSSVLSPEAISRDPENRFLSRGPRFRLDGEVIRDSALAVSGLLDNSIGGPSVYPYHPEGLWLEINNRPGFSKAYPHQTDLKQHHRRSMYSFWKRTVTPPSVATFDAPSREYCVVRRSRTNTPLQAFVMLNDPQFVEASRHLAARMIREGGQSMDSQIEYGFRLCTTRIPKEKELEILKKAYAESLVKYEADSDAITALFSVGLAPVDSSLDPAQVAAMTSVARMLLNLSEFITKG